MVVDTSAILAILFDEPEAEHFEVVIEQAPERVVSAATVLEAGIIIEARLGEEGGREFDLMLHKARFEIAAVTSEQAELARDAWRRFGKGRHPAGLNFGDCFAYGLAVSRGLPLLYKGDDFAHTDIEPASPPRR